VLALHPLLAAHACRQLLPTTELVELWLPGHRAESTLGAR
jgi:hypothetical protein